MRVQKISRRIARVRAALQQNLPLPGARGEGNNARLIETYEIGSGHCDQYHFASRKGAWEFVHALPFSKVNWNDLLRLPAVCRNTRDSARNHRDEIDRVVIRPCSTREAFHGA